jgi:hypothetical protein
MLFPSFLKKNIINKSKNQTCLNKKGQKQYAAYVEKRKIKDKESKRERMRVREE